MELINDEKNIAKQIVEILVSNKCSYSSLPHIIRQVQDILGSQKIQSFTE